MNEITIIPIQNKKVWIVEKNGQKVGSLLTVGDTSTLTLLSQEEKKYFNNIEDFIKYTDAKELPKQKEHVKTKELYGFPFEGDVAYNGIYDVQHKVPLYTKEEESKSYYCAGYYVIDNKVVFCPKFIKIARKNYQGPYKSIEEAVKHVYSSK